MVLRLVNPLLWELEEVGIPISMPLVMDLARLKTITYRAI
jgi:hypothetical protein